MRFSLPKIELPRFKRSGTGSTSTSVQAPRPRSREPEGFIDKIFWPVILGSVLLICLCSILLFFGTSKKGINQSSVQDATQTVVVAMITQAAQSKTPVNKQTPASVKAVSTAVPTAKVTVNKTTPVLPTPKATATVTPTVVAAVYVPPWQREYNSNWEIIRTFLGLLILAVAPWVVLAYWLWKQSLPQEMPDLSMEVGFSQGSISFRWSMLAQYIIKPAALFRAKTLKGKAFGQLQEGCQDIIQQLIGTLTVDDNLPKNFERLIGELNRAFGLAEEGRGYRTVAFKEVGRMTDGLEKTQRAQTVNEIVGALAEIKDLERRLGVRVIKIFIGSAFEPSADLKNYLDSLRVEIEETREAEERLKRQRDEEDRLNQQRIREAEQARLRIEADVRELTTKINLFVFQQGLSPNSPQAQVAIAKFLELEAEKARRQAAQTLARLQLEHTVEKDQRQAAIDERRAEAEAQRARAMSELADSVRGIASGLNLDVQALVRTIFGGKASRPVQNNRGGGNGEQNQ